MLFVGVHSIDGYVDLNTIKPNVDHSDEKDWGNIENFEIDGNNYRIETYFTTIQLNCNTAIFVLNE